MTAFENIVFAEVFSTVFYTFFGLVLMLACWWLIELVTPFSLRKELEEDQNTAIAIVAVTAMWDVVVNDFGNRPITLATRIKMNSVKMYGKYFRPSLPAMSSTIL